MYDSETNSNSDSKMMYQVTYQVPYGDCQWKIQSFSSLQQAQKMIDFYRSCGSPAKLIQSQK